MQELSRMMSSHSPSVSQPTILSNMYSMLAGEAAYLGKGGRGGEREGGRKGKRN